MASIVRDLIEYNGISDFFPAKSKSFRQLNVQEEFYIPCQKPDMDRIVKVTGEISIPKYRVIKTPKGTSLEGNKLTGWKLLIEGSMIQKIQYVDCGASKSVYLVNFISPFSTFIILPEYYSRNVPLTVSSYIEDIYVKQLSKRCFLSIITVLIDAQTC